MRVPILRSATLKVVPFWKLYYPGVPEREKAKVISLKHGEVVNNLKVVIPK